MKLAYTTDTCFQDNIILKLYIWVQYLLQLSGHVFFPTEHCQHLWQVLNLWIRAPVCQSQNHVECRMKVRELFQPNNWLQHVKAFPVEANAQKVKSFRIRNNKVSKFSDPNLVELNTIQKEKQVRQKKKNWKCSPPPFTPVFWTGNSSRELCGLWSSSRHFLY